MKSIFDYLDEMQQDIFSMPIKEFEEKYLNICVHLSGRKQGEKIQSMDLVDYQRLLTDTFMKTVRKLNNDSIKAIYFEYDMDNEWNSQYYLCAEYQLLLDDDDDWACEWIDSIQGPSLPIFADIYTNNGGFQNPSQIGVTLYLIARTIGAFAIAVSASDGVSNIPICIAYHDQDPIIRIFKD